MFGAGQTWSPFMDPDVFPDSIEYWGPNGMVFFRNVQIRFMPLRGPASITLAAERPGSTQDTNGFEEQVDIQNVSARHLLPDFSGHFRRPRAAGVTSRPRASFATSNGMTWRRRRPI